MSGEPNGNGNGRRQPSWAGVGMALLVPSLLGLIAGAQLFSRVEQLERDRARLDIRSETLQSTVIILQGRIDALATADNPRLRDLERAVAVIEGELDANQDRNTERMNGIAGVMAEMQRMVGAALERMRERAEAPDRGRE